MKIRAYKPADEIAIVDLWHQCDLVRPWNDPHLDIRRKLDVQPELFLVAEQGSNIVGTGELFGGVPSATRQRFGATFNAGGRICFGGAWMSKTQYSSPQHQ